MGTLNGALEVRGIRLDADAIRARAEGINEVKDRIPVLTKVHVHYSLRVPSGSRETVDRALERHVSKCPTAQSLKDAVEFSWSADIEEDA